MFGQRTILAWVLGVAFFAFPPALAQVPDLKTGGTVPTLAPVVRQVMPAVVNISVHGRVREDNPHYRDPFFREFFDIPKQVEKEVNSTGRGSSFSRATVPTRLFAMAAVSSRYKTCCRTA